MLSSPLTDPHPTGVKGHPDLQGNSSNCRCSSGNIYFVIIQVAFRRRICRRHRGLAPPPGRKVPPSMET